MERLWPTLQAVDSSSGALGTATNKTVHELIEILLARAGGRRAPEAPTPLCLPGSLTIISLMPPYPGQRPRPALYSFRPCDTSTKYRWPSGSISVSSDRCTRVGMIQVSRRC
jgi:hypothetical protein